MNPFVTPPARATLLRARSLVWTGVNYTWMAGPGRSMAQPASKLFNMNSLSGLRGKPCPGSAADTLFLRSPAMA